MSRCIMIAASIALLAMASVSFAGNGTQDRIQARDGTGVNCPCDGQCDGIYCDCCPDCPVCLGDQDRDQVRDQDQTQAQDGSCDQCPNQGTCDGSQARTRAGR